MRKWILGLPLVVAVVGCESPSGAAESRPLSGAQVLRPAPPVPESEDPGESVTDAEIEALAAAMTGDLARGDYQAALDASDALYARGPTSSQRNRLETMRAEARRRLLQTLFVDGLIRVDKDELAIGEPISGEVLLVNLSGRKLSIYDLPRDGSRRGEGARSSLHFDVRYTEFAADGTLVDDRLTWTVAVGRDVILEPGGRAAFPLDLDTMAQNPGASALRTYEISAVLYPAEIRVDDENLPGVVRFKPRIVRVFPRNYEHLKKDPVGRLAEAVRKRSAVHLPLAAALVPPADRERALEVLRIALWAEGSEAPDDRTAVAVCVAARVLTGFESAPEPKLWAERLGKPGRTEK